MRGAGEYSSSAGLETNIDTQARFKAYRDTLRTAASSSASDDVYYLDYTYESAYRLAIGTSA